LKFKAELFPGNPAEKIAGQLSLGKEESKQEIKKERDDFTDG